MQLEAVGHPLRPVDRDAPQPGEGELVIRVSACAVCRTDLHIVDGDLVPPALPLVPGHEVVGVVEARGAGAQRFALGTRVGVPWLGWTCGRCPDCQSGRENLCSRAGFTGFTRDGGFATHMVADERFCLPVPTSYSDAEAAPLLCAGLIGYRALVRAGDGRRLGLYGFGAAAHIVAQVALAQGREVCAFTRPGDRESQAFARGLGVTWAGGSDAPPPQALDTAIIFAPAGELVPAALRAVRPGGTVVCAGIHMSDIPALPYALLWGERSLCSVANLTRRDGTEFMALAATVRLRVTVRERPLAEANEALTDLRAGRVQGAVVLRP